MTTIYSASLLLHIFGGRVADLHSVLTEERLPPGWQPRVRAPMGLTLTAANGTAIKIELGISKTTVNGPKSTN